MTWQERASRHLIRYAGSFSSIPVAKARGATLWDTAGRTYLDFSSGQMCATIGHNHPRVIAALQQAATRSLHLNSWILAPEVVDLAERLCALLPETLQKAILLSTGSESTEVALKLAKQYTGRFEVVGFSRSFHGLTSGAAASTYVVGHRGSGPTVPGTFALPTPYAYRCPIRHCQGRCDCTCLEVGFELIDAQSVGSLAALIAEPILSAGGIIVPPPGYWQRAAALCRQRGMLLIFDEAQTGLGRVGATFAFEQEGVIPDILTLSKTLGGGIPLAATITSAAIEEDCHTKGFHYLTSHVSDPLPATVGLAVLEVILQERLAERAAELGTYLKARLQELQVRHEWIGDVRGRGLLLGIELVQDRTTKECLDDRALWLNDRCLALGLSMNLLRRSGTTVWRVAPPLTVERDELDRGVEIIDRALSELAAWPHVPSV